MKVSDLQGVYYRREDYAGLWRRLLIMVIDTIVVITISIVISALLSEFIPQGGLLGLALLAVWPIIWFAYLVILKRTRIRTLGYIIGGVRIVNLQGENPSLRALSIRLLFAILGPFTPVIDLFWIPADGRKQALRDKFAKTYVIKKNALPAGQGRVVYASYTIMALNFLFQEVSESFPKGVWSMPP